MNGLHWVRIYTFKIYRFSTSYNVVRISYVVNRLFLYKKLVKSFTSCVQGLGYQLSLTILSWTDISIELGLLWSPETQYHQETPIALAWVYTYFCRVLNREKGWLWLSALLLVKFFTFYTVVGVRQPQEDVFHCLVEESRWRVCGNRALERSTLNQGICIQ